MTFASMRRTRGLSAEEHALWRSITEGVAPLRPKRAKPMPKEAVPPEPVPAPASAKPKRASPAVAARAPASACLAPLGPLERRLKARVARGREPIDARLDLHGLTQARAQAALLGFLDAAQRRGAKIVLVITGKGRRSAGWSQPSLRHESGVLRQLVPHWLALPEFRAYVLAFETAHSGHGGEGALYIRLRRKR